MIDPLTYVPPDYPIVSLRSPQHREEGPQAKVRPLYVSGILLRLRFQELQADKQRFPSPSTAGHAPLTILSPHMHFETLKPHLPTAKTAASAAPYIHGRVHPQCSMSFASPGPPKATPFCAPQQSASVFLCRLLTLRGEITSPTAAHGATEFALVKTWHREWAQRPKCPLLTPPFHSWPQMGPRHCCHRSP